MPVPLADRQGCAVDHVGAQLLPGDLDRNVSRERWEREHGAGREIQPDAEDHAPRLIIHVSAIASAAHMSFLTLYSGPFEAADPTGPCLSIKA